MQELMRLHANKVTSAVFYLGLFFLFLMFFLQSTPISGPLRGNPITVSNLIIENRGYDEARSTDVNKKELIDPNSENISEIDEDGSNKESELQCLPNCTDGVGEKRKFHAYGSGAYLFIEMSAYRGGPREFFINGLGSKPIHVYSQASFKCEWVPSVTSNVSSPIQGKAEKMLPDWGFGRVYTVVIVMCTFDQDVGTDIQGGELILYASPTIISPDSSTSTLERIVALKESQGDYNSSIFQPPFPYEIVYCGSPLYGEVNPQRIREWVAYHLRIFGPRSHLVLYDAGGIHPDVQKVLEPWVKAGRITIENVRAQEQYDGYYHNQFLIVNDCLHKTRFMTNWTFFFDVDEYLYLPINSSLESLLQEHSNYTQIFFEQMPMSHNICIADSSSNYQKMWGFEKLVFKSVKRIHLDRKYAIQPRKVFATGVHLTMNLIGESYQPKGEKLRYYHFHGTTAFMGEVCRQFINISWDNHDTVWSRRDPFMIDLSMHELASIIKDFEFEQIGGQANLL